MKRRPKAHQQPRRTSQRPASSCRCVTGSGSSIDGSANDPLVCGRAAARSSQADHQPVPIAIRAGSSHAGAARGRRAPDSGRNRSARPAPRARHEQDPTGRVQHGLTSTRSTRTPRSPPGCPPGARPDEPAAKREREPRIARGHHDRRCRARSRSVVKARKNVTALVSGSDTSQPRCRSPPPGGEARAAIGAA